MQQQHISDIDNRRRVSSIALHFEELRQTVTLNNAVRERRQTQHLHNYSQKQQNQENKIPHINKYTMEYEDLETQVSSFTEKVQVSNQNHDEMVEQTANQIQAKVDHKISLDRLYKKYQTSFQNGLASDQADKLLQEHGENKLTEKEKTPWWVLLLKELTNGFAIMLWIGGILCFITYALNSSDPSNLYLGIVIIIVISITAVITFQQNAKSEAIMDSFKNFIPQNSTVIRDGNIKTVPAVSLVVGDIVLVKAGEKIPADIRIIESNEMKVDNSPLTGECEPLLRTVECSHPDSYLETSNLAFFGTLCKEGTGKGVVICTGDRTTLGQIADLTSGDKKAKTPLRIELDRFVLMITIIAIVLGVLFFFLAFFVMKYDSLTCIIFGIGILVANVPEGLLGCITVSLAITAKNLSKKSVLVKNLEAVETLGSTTCICSDKTGTLTQNVMSVKHMWYNNKIHIAQNQKLLNGGKADYEINDSNFMMLHQAAMICSEARFDTSSLLDKADIDYLTCPVIGDATETGLIRFYQYISDVNKFRDRFKVVRNSDGTQAKMPFNSSVKFALTIVEEKSNNSNYCIYIKGAPEKIWAYCSSVFVSSKTDSINQKWKDEFKKVNLIFGKGGERVLGFARLPLPSDLYPVGSHFTVSSVSKFNFKLENFQFCGLVSLMDPPKTRVPAAILECRSAGIKVIMVTGDQPPTAAEHLVSGKLITISYLQLGQIGSAAGFIGYFVCFNYLGFPIKSLFGIANISGFKPPINDFGTYGNNPYYNSALEALTLGDCNKNSQAAQKLSYNIDWSNLSDVNYDLRKSLLKCNPQGKWVPAINWSACDVSSQHYKSDQVKITSCYSIDAIYWAQSVYFVCIVSLQWSNIFACKSRKMSFTTSAFNKTMLQGVVFETLLSIFLLYVPGVQDVFGGRSLPFFLFAVPGLVFSAFLLTWEEMRKYLARNQRWFLKYVLW
ncbi:hypothetical protein ABPG73_017918 [Tetrahymena malaccensis]